LYGTIWAWSKFFERKDFLPSIQNQRIHPKKGKIMKEFIKKEKKNERIHQKKREKE
jgi:hypothetical protein